MKAKKNPGKMAQSRPIYVSYVLVIDYMKQWMLYVLVNSQGNMNIVYELYSHKNNAARIYE